MGPREALDRIAELIKLGLAVDDNAALHRLLEDMKSIADTARGDNKPSRARLYGPRIRKDFH